MTNDQADKPGKSDGPSATGLPGWQVIPRFLLWLGGSTGVIGVVLTAFGFLVEHAYLDRLGIPRSLYQAAPDEYVVTGGEFLMGIAPLALAGMLQLCMNYWWLALGTVIVGAVTWWRIRSSNLRWLIAAGWMAIALLTLSLRFQGHNAPDYPGVAMFTFVVVAGLTFSYVEICFGRHEAVPTPSLSHYAFRFPFVMILVCSLVALPYLRGYYALARDYPVVQFLAKDKTLFCDLAAVQNSAERAACEQETWEIVDIGKDRAILRRVADSRIYVVPAGSLTTFRILGKEQKP